jgi:hypothetical protein
MAKIHGVQRMVPSVRMTPRVRLHAEESGQQLLAETHTRIDGIIKLVERHDAQCSTLFPVVA